MYVWIEFGLGMQPPSPANMRSLRDVCLCE
jgi:hypothetical protein